MFLNAELKGTAWKFRGEGNDEQLMKISCWVGITIVRKKDVLGSN